jgi:hypothetical protein
MNAPIRLRADPAALPQAERRSLVRACAAIVLGNKPGAPHSRRRSSRPGTNAMAGRVLKALVGNALAPLPAPTCGASAASSLIYLGKYPV